MLISREQSQSRSRNFVERPTEIEEKIRRVEKYSPILRATRLVNKTAPTFLFPNAYGYKRIKFCHFHFRVHEEHNVLLILIRQRNGGFCNFIKMYFCEHTNGQCFLIF